MLKKIILARPRGFCAGVERAIDIVEQVIRKHGVPVHVKHEIVHNRHVVDDFRKRGVKFIESPCEAPDGAVLVYSAHGVSQAVRRAAEIKNQIIYDATCPLVTKVHSEVTRLRAAGYEIIMVGHRGHPEVEGTLGQCENGMHLVENENDVTQLNLHNDKLAFVTQTTLSVDDTARLVLLLKNKFPHIRTPRKDDICYATQNRQEAVKKMSQSCQTVLVVGSPSSSNSNRLREVAVLAGAQAHLIDSADEIHNAWFDNVTVAGVTAGASAPEPLVQEVVACLQDKFGQCEVEEMSGKEEKVVFVAPKSLTRTAAALS